MEDMRCSVRDVCLIFDEALRTDDYALIDILPQLTLSCAEACRLDCRLCELISIALHREKFELLELLFARGLALPFSPNFLRCCHEKYSHVVDFLIFSHFPGDFVGDLESVDLTVEFRLDNAVAAWRDGVECLNPPNGSGEGPLYYATKYGLITICKRLLLLGADPSISGYFGTPLHVAAAGGHFSLCKLYIEHGADINVKTCLGYTPLHLAVSNNHMKVCELLLEHNCNVMERTIHGETPLHMASLWGGVPLFQLLVSNGADISSVTSDGLCALHLAVEQGKVAVCEYLVSLGANSTHCDKDDEPLLELAFSHLKTHQCSSMEFERIMQLLN